MKSSVLHHIMILLILFLLAISGLRGQDTVFCVRVYSLNAPLPSARITLSEEGRTLYTDSSGLACFRLKHNRQLTVRCEAESHKPALLKWNTADSGYMAVIRLEPLTETFREFVVTGTLKHIKRSESPVNVEVYQQSYFRKNPTPALFDALQNVNGVRPQLNCNVCNTGDIHINGLEGPYTMVLIDGMPIVSSLSTVYGLSGIPNSLVERLEIVKGPASSLYGSEAVGGLINVITKRPEKAALFSADAFATSWGEFNNDLSFVTGAGKKAKALTGINYYHFDRRVDKNQDGFTDVTLQQRISVFQKWSFRRRDYRLFSLAGRYFHENRWGGDTRWNREFRGGDSIYGESIYTSRAELTGMYQLPVREKLMLSFSYNHHRQNSYYGTVPFMALQQIAFTQLTWDKSAGRHDWLAGLTYRHTFYDDNTPATRVSGNTGDVNSPQQISLPGIFIQDEYSFPRKVSILGGMRYDRHSVHGNILTPRLAFKWAVSKLHSLRLNYGTGFRVVNLFTEDHAALTGARTLLIREELDPERSSNVNLNYLGRFLIRKKYMLGIDLTAFHTYFSNRIIADYETDPDKIIYDNLEGHAVSRGIGCNIDFSGGSRYRALAGFTLMDVYSSSKQVKTRQILTERFSATWALTYTPAHKKFSIDYTGNLYGPMRLPLLGPLDPRKPYSPWWSIQNIQISLNAGKKIRVYFGIKNLLDWTPNRGNPFIIARSKDPFDKHVQYGPDGKVLATPENPYALTFDPNYVYGPNQGIRFFFGLNYTLQP